ncbi:hypothetical protein RCL1_002242 [Eukaryota sp. TZLM3-RCL]
MSDQKISYVSDPRVHNAALITIKDEDHTIGNLLQSDIAENNPNVVFVGYRAPHPYVQQIELRIRMNEEELKGPDSAFSESITRLHSSISNIKQVVESELNRLRHRDSSVDRNLY